MVFLTGHNFDPTEFQNSGYQRQWYAILRWPASPLASQLNASTNSGKAGLGLLGMELPLGSSYQADSVSAPGGSR